MQIILYIKHYGQLCNRLWAIVPALAFTIHHNKTLNVFWGNPKYINYFPNLKQCENIRFYWSRKYAPKWEWRLNNFVNSHEIKDDLQDYCSKDLPYMSFVDGWKHGNDVSFIQENIDVIKMLFQPTKEVCAKIHAALDDYDGITIGVHVRRGDYKDYLGGKYYFENEVYIKCISRLYKQFSEIYNKVRILICSNEDSRISIPNVEIVRIPDSNEITDLYALSKCDFIIGPPSSFSQWASFIGNVPIAFMLSESDEITISDFSPIVTFNRFKNNRRIEFDEDKQCYYLRAL